MAMKHARPVRQTLGILTACMMMCVGLACGRGDESKPQTASNSGQPGTPSAESAPATPSNSTPAKVASKWSVTHQLVYGQPWPSEKSSEAELQAAVKESESAGDQRLVLSLNDLAGWHRGKKNYAEAEKLYKRVLDVQSKRMGAEHHDVALTHNDLAVIYTESNRSADAEADFKEALRIWQKSWEMELRTEDEAVTQHNYAALLEKMGRGADAKALEAKADAIMAARKKAFGF